MSNDQTGQTPRRTTGGSPAASTIMIVVTVLAVVVGFFILKTIRDDGGSTSGPKSPGVGATTSTTMSGATTTLVAPTTTQAMVFTGTSVQVANASTGSGVAGKLSTDLAGKGFTMAKATNAKGANLATSKVLYDPANSSAKAVADTVAVLMGGIEVAPLPAAVPTSEGKLPTGTGVLVMLGNDRAGKTLAQMGGATVTPSSVPSATVIAGATTSTTIKA
ncbi:MAG: LytR C-terminal domain-containing protein [Ilumatobacteraceae bacterium]